MLFKRAHRVLIIGGGKDHRDVRTDQFQHVKSRQLGHLHIEEDQAGLVLGESFGGFEAVGALRENFNLRMGFEQFANDVPCEILVVHDQRSDLLGWRTQLCCSPVSAGSNRLTQKRSASAQTCRFACSPYRLCKRRRTLESPMPPRRATVDSGSKVFSTVMARRPS